MRKSDLKRLLTSEAIALGFIVMAAVSAFSVDILAKTPHDLSQSGRGARSSHNGLSGSAAHNLTLRASVANGRE